MTSNIIILHTGNILNTLQDKLEELNENSDSKSPGYKNTELLTACKLLGISSLKTAKNVTLEANEDEKFSTTVKLFLAKDASPDTVFQTVSKCHSSFENKLQGDSENLARKWLKMTQNAPNDPHQTPKNDQKRLKTPKNAPKTSRNAQNFKHP